MIESEETEAHRHLRSLEKRCHWVRGNTPVSVFASRNRRTRDRRHAADGRCAGRQRRSRNKFTIALPGRRTIRICGGGAGHTNTRKRGAVWGRGRGAIGGGLPEGNELVFLPIP